MKCPKCNSEMVLKTARKGKNAGNQFYGCSKYPSCKGVVSISDDQADNNTQISSLNIGLPVFLVAREKISNYQVRFFETIALPQHSLENIFSEKINRSDIKGLNQWRIDFPINPSIVSDVKQKQVFLVAHKILTRGRITQTSPYIEYSIQKYLGLNNNVTQNIFNLGCLKYVITKNDLRNYLLDGFGTEHNFFHEILSQYLGDNYKKYVLPQVQLSSLLGNDINLSDNRRVDFLITTDDKRIVVELEGAEHTSHSDSDYLREKLLINNGFEVYRIKNEEIQNRVGINLQNLLDTLPKTFPQSPIQLSANSSYLLAVKIIHQIQITILEAILNGFIDFINHPKIYFDTDSLKLNRNLQKEILEIAGTDLKGVIYNLCKIYNVNMALDNFEILPLNNNDSAGIVITYNTGLVSNKPKFIVQDITFPFPIAQFDRPVNHAVLADPDKNGVKYFLQYIFRHDDFLEGQFEAISRTLKGEDSIVLLPTGAGKSVAFQLASMLLPGVTIVIDPLVSLIDDQIDNLKRVGIDRAVGITSQITDQTTKAKVIKVFGQGEYLFCYIAPERFQTQEYRDTVGALTVSTPVSAIVIDEAHCVSEWGHDFRTSYLNIGRISREYCGYNGNVPPLLALTGTASNSVLRDVQRELQIESIDSIITPNTFDRKELFFNIYESTSDKKFTILRGILQRVLPNKFNLSPTSFYQSRENQTHSGVIFCPHISGSFGVHNNAEIIKKELNIETKYYAGGQPRNWNNIEDWNQYKRKTAKEFKTNKFPLLVATKSFGMGIDKPNIRYTIHYGLPFSVESFYQEAGRAGRDRKNAECYVILSNDHKNRTLQLLEPSRGIEELNAIMQSNRTLNNDDDITRALYFHLKAFKGLSNEMDDLKSVIKRIENLETQRKINVIFEDLERHSSEKCIHRLLTLGIISDYTINYSNNEFTIEISGISKEGMIDKYCRYVNGYNKGRVRIEKQKISVHLKKAYHDFIVEASKVLIEFIYDTVEKGRRRALREVLAVAEAAKNKNSEVANQIVRERILKYLETSHSEEIEEILNEVGSFYCLRKIVEGEVVTSTGEIIGGIRSSKDVLEIRGQVSRYLESYPDHPGLLFLRAISELFTPEFDNEIINQSIFAAINFSTKRYSIKKQILYKTLCWILALINNKDNELYSGVVANILYEMNDVELARELMKSPELEESMIYYPAIYLFSNYSKKLKSLIK